jgi:amidohydrolase
LSVVKTAIAEAVDRLANALDGLSRKIHANPELCYQEVKAAEWLTDFLEGNDLKVERGVGGIETAFRATIENGAGPTVAILCEYDALPEIGHACGHNVIAASGAGAGAALAAVKDHLPAGRIQVIGTPAEEGGGGKIKLLSAGVFDGVDCAMMIHGLDRFLLHSPLLGIVRVSVEFHGKAAHASAAPWKGINALDAVIQTFNGINALRQHLRPEVRIHRIITNGGVAPNIIPEYAAATFYVRAASIASLREVQKKFIACAEGAAAATGARLQVSQDEMVYQPLKRNETLLSLFKANLNQLGVMEEPPESEVAMGSSDIGNVSQALPAIHPYIKLAPSGTPIHSRDFAEAAVGPAARQGLLIAAKTLAMTAADLLMNPDAVARAKKEFEERS